MSQRARVLYQFPLSLYCEKTAWNLDHKRLDYRCCNLMPGPHLPLAYGLAGIPTLPILRDGNRVTGDSTAIALWLEREYPQQPLLPADPVARERALMFEGYFDELGDHVRRCVWSMAVDGPRIDRIFYGFAGYGPLVKMLGRLTVPLLRRTLVWRFRLQPARVQDSWRRVLSALDHLESLLDGDAARYLVGDTFTLADLTAATMLAPLFGPPGSPWSDERLGLVPDPQREALRRRPAGRWVLAIYAKHRARD